jgi:threonine/homoserine/homoserine lactone efflux protein
VIDPIVLWTFIPAALALNLTPGVDMMFCLGQGLRSGPRAAIAGSAGISLGALVHATLAGIGLGAAVTALPWLFDVIRWLGVGYLLWLAIGAFRGGIGAAEAPLTPPSQALRNGFMVNLFNPKVILFALAFVPQFIDPAGQILGQYLIFGAILGLGGFIINGLVGVFAGSMGRRLTGSPRMARVLGYVSGGIFAGLAIRLALLERS